MQFSLKEIQQSIPESEIQNCEKPENLMISKIGVLPDGGEEAILFLNTKSYLKEILSAKMKAIITTKELGQNLSVPTIVTKNPDMAMVSVVNLFFPSDKPDGKRGEHSVIHSTTEIGINTDIGNFVTIGKNVKIGKNSIISDGVKILNDTEIGENAYIGPNSVIYNGVKIGKNFICFGNSTIGSEGFRFVPDKSGKHHRIPQVGTVVIGDDVRIGSNCTIDRGGMNDTKIGDGVKLDDQIHIGHNCTMGKNCVMAGKSALAGSVVLGDNVIVGGAVCISDHVHISSGAIIAGGSGVRGDVNKPGIYAGWDVFLEYADFQKFRANIKYLPNLHRIIKRIKTLEEKSGIDSGA